ncbi:MAG: BMP family ABC transporter substrate-binding protein [Candidatus Tectomicrobia bacterium]|nr:BMP family ABC transporter substrate-binding protein [Candidatus Tectomicrobia bacterium]
MIRKRILPWALLFALLLFPLTGRSDAQSTPVKKPLKAAFIYDGPVGDAGYTQAHDFGRRHLEKAVPGVETSYSESVSNADVERVILGYARRGFGLIFTTTFSFMDPSLTVAKRYPNIVFMNGAGFKLAKNMGNYWAREYQARYLTGLVAGRMTRSNIIGYVAAHPYPTVMRGINGFALGVRAANPRAKVRVVFTQVWYDPAKEREATDSLIDVGADVISQHQDSPAPVQVAERRGKYAIGYNWDMSRFGPKAHLTAAIFQWGVVYEAVAKQVLAGTWKSEALFWGMEKGAVDISPLNPVVPQDVRSLVEGKKKEIASGAFDIFQGPIKDHKGKLRVAEGKRPTDPELLSMNYLLEGVEGTIP